MGIVNDLKKIFFGASSVAKSAAESSADFIKEEGGDILAKGKEMASEAGKVVLEKGADLKDAVVDGSEGILGGAKDKLDDVAAGGGILGTAKEKLSGVVDDISDNSFVQSAKEKMSNIADDLAENPLVQSAQEKAENLGSKILDAGGDAAEKGLEVSESVGEKLLEAKDRVAERAGEVSDKISDKMDETMKKAQAWEAEQANKPPKGEFAEKDLDAGGSLLDGSDDFFSKADKFGDGDYDAVNEGKVIVDQIEEAPKDTSKTIADLAGFEDSDGDGNPLIDDIDIINDDTDG